MRFTESHEWIFFKEKIGTVGISRHASRELGEIVYVALPQVGQKMKAGEEVCVLESTKAAADVYSPVSGTVTAVNEALRSNPALLNTSPETEGWLFQLELSQPDELNRLLPPQDYAALVS
jgi:glycine cleavage system H protein